MEDDSHIGRPATTTTEKNIDFIHDVGMDITRSANKNSRNSKDSGI